MAVRNQRGFSMIEMMAVVSITSILAAIVAVEVGSVLGRVRNQVRRQTVRTLQEALEHYRVDHGRYPSAVDSCLTVQCSSEPGDAWPWGINNDGQWIRGLVPTYINHLPRDPIGGASTEDDCQPAVTQWPSVMRRAYWYQTTLDGSTYQLRIHCGMELMGHAPYTDLFKDPLYIPGTNPSPCNLGVCVGPACPFP